MNAPTCDVIAAATASLDYRAFSKAMTNVCKVVQKKNTAPIIGGVLIRHTPGGVQVIGTDLDRYTQSFVPGEVTGEFVALVDAHRLKATMDKVKDATTINFTAGAEHLVASVGKLNLTISLLGDIKDFPLDEPFRQAIGKATCAFVLPAVRLLTMLDKVSLAISTDETRYYLNGIYMHVASHERKLTFVATDGHRMARYQIEIPSGAGAMPEPGIIIPHKTVLELRRLVGRKDCPADVFLSVAASGVSFLIGEDELVESKVIDGTYPDYGRAMPIDNHQKVGIQSRALIEAIQQTSGIKSKSGEGLLLSFATGRLTLSCKESEFGVASFEMKTFGSFDLRIGFNSRYLLEILGQLEGGAMLELRDAESPITIKDGADPCADYCLMPMRV